MGLRENFQKLVNKKQEELAALELQIREAKAYIQAMQDSLRLLPKDGNGLMEYTLRAGTDLAKTRDILKVVGSPMPIAEILKALGRPTDKKHRTSLAGTLSSYARQEKIFTRTSPNTFGLLEFSNAQDKPELEETDSEVSTKAG